MIIQAPNQISQSSSTFFSTDSLAYYSQVIQRSLKQMHLKATDLEIYRLRFSATARELFEVIVPSLKPDSKDINVYSEEPKKVVQISLEKSFSILDRKVSVVEFCFDPKAKSSTVLSHVELEYVGFQLPREIKTGAQARQWFYDNYRESKIEISQLLNNKEISFTNNHNYDPKAGDWRLSLSVKHARTGFEVRFISEPEVTNQEISLDGLTGPVGAEYFAAKSEEATKVRRKMIAAINSPQFNLNDLYSSGFFEISTR